MFKVVSHFTGARGLARAYPSLYACARAQNLQANVDLTSQTCGRVIQCGEHMFPQPQLCTCPNYISRPSFYCNPRKNAFRQHRSGYRILACGERVTPCATHVPQPELCICPNYISRPSLYRKPRNNAYRQYVSGNRTPAGERITPCVTHVPQPELCMGPKYAHYFTPPHISSRGDIAWRLGDLRIRLCLTALLTICPALDLTSPFCRWTAVLCLNMH